MSNFPSRKKPPTGNDMKSTTQGTVLRQQDFHEVNKRRAFLQDNSWIKTRLEEEKDENYGRVVLNRHNSHDALDRKIIERVKPKATISRYRSDDTLDRISDRHDAAKTYKALDNQLTNRSVSMFRSPEATKLRPGTQQAPSTNTTASTPMTTPVKKKRQSWFPPPPPGYSATSSTEACRRDPAIHPPIPPKPRSPVSSPNQLRWDNRHICPPKPGVYIETNRSAERNIRSQDGDTIIKVPPPLPTADKGEELDNLIKMNKNLNRANLKAEPTEKRAQSLESLIHINSHMDKDGKGNKTLDSFIKENPRVIKNDKGNQCLGSLNKVNQRTDRNEESRDLQSLIKPNARIDEPRKGKQDLGGLIKVNSETNKNIKRGQSLENLIKVTEINRSNQSSKEISNVIKVSLASGKSMQRNQDLDKLIKVTPSENKSSERGLDELIIVSPKSTSGKQDLDKLIKVNPETLINNQRSQDLDNLIKVNPLVIRNNQSQNLDNLIKVKPSALRNTNRDQDLENLIEVNSHMSGKKNGSSSAGTRHVRPKDTVVYTRTYVENSKSPKGGNQETTSGKYIQTVYSTSDRSVIEKDMCTYCRKPLGIETKMILDELQICCHSTCFKCEICKQPLGNLQAGDSIWIYRQTIHCEPCYSKVMAKWIQ